jgi:hypothetical protein
MNSGGSGRVVFDMCLHILEPVTYCARAGQVRKTQTDMDGALTNSSVIDTYQS